MRTQDRRGAAAGIYTTAGWSPTRCYAQAGGSPPARALPSYPGEEIGARLALDDADAGLRQAVRVGGVVQE